jgi:hypothetical protein
MAAGHLLDFINIIYNIANKGLYTGFSPTKSLGTPCLLKILMHNFFIIAGSLPRRPGRAESASPGATASLWKPAASGGCLDLFVLETQPNFHLLKGFRDHRVLNARLLS